jgi:hypothetical protein
MKTILYHLLFAFFAASLCATPLAEFKAGMQTEYEEELPLFWITWDSESKEARKIWDQNYDRYLAIRKQKIAEHTRFVRRVTGNDKIEYDEYGYRSDRQDLDAIALTPEKWVLSISDDQSGDAHRWLRWSRVKGFTTRDHALKALSKFKESTQSFHVTNPTSATGNLLKEIDEAISAINQMLDEAVTLKVDDQIKLRKFIQKWMK